MILAIPALWLLEFDDTNTEHDLVEWLKHMENAFLAFDIMEEMKRLVFKFYGGTKLKEIKSLILEVPADQVELTYKTTTMALSLYFTETINKVFPCHKFGILAHELKENIHNYVNGLWIQGTKCNYKKLWICSICKK